MLYLDRFYAYVPNHLLVGVTVNFIVTNVYIGIIKHPYICVFLTKVTLDIISPNN